MQTLIPIELQIRWTRCVGTGVCRIGLCQIFLQIQQCCDHRIIRILITLWFLCYVSDSVWLWSDTKHTRSWEYISLAYVLRWDSSLRQLNVFRTSIVRWLTSDTIDANIGIQWEARIRCSLLSSEHKSWQNVKMTSFHTRRIGSKNHKTLDIDRYRFLLKFCSLLSLVLYSTQWLYVWQPLPTYRLLYQFFPQYIIIDSK